MTVDGSCPHVWTRAIVLNGLQGPTAKVADAVLTGIEVTLAELGARRI
ncbi:hypothetical protein AB0N29_19580 [Nocardioides sp. NPDC092400]